MSLIPKLRITKENEISAIRENQQLNRLPDDVTEIIISYFGQEIEMDDVDTFWISLGNDTCNLSKFGKHSGDILNNSFPISRYYYLKELGTGDQYCLFHKLKNDLEDLFHYKCPNYENRYNLDLFDVFFHNDDIISYQIQEPTWEKKKSITSQDKEYIETFIKKTNIYLNYLKDNVHLFPVDLTVHQLRREKLEHHCNREVIKTANKIERKINKLSIMMCDINIQD